MNSKILKAGSGLEGSCSTPGVEVGEVSGDAIFEYDMPGMTGREVDGCGAALSLTLCGGLGAGNLGHCL